ncbi:hypothetical protein PPGU19_074010 (plasmid) [Paraburkholderia sp. PGU19]|nr:hypothetical protein PPGU19_074010 [Paraburkholderia sp. PGU19]
MLFDPRRRLRSRFRLLRSGRARAHGNATGILAKQIATALRPARDRLLLSAARSTPKLKAILTCDDLRLPPCYLAW